MTENKLKDRVTAQLKEQYGKDRVVVEPSGYLSRGVYPDIGVFRTNRQEKPFLLIECSTFRTSHRQNKDLKEISNAVEQTEASYGALVGPDVEFVFSGSGPKYRTYGTFPEFAKESSQEQRAIQSQSELKFLVDRALTARRKVQTEPTKEKQAVDDFLETLHLLLEARRTDVDITENLMLGVINDLKSRISNRHQFYQPQGEYEVASVEVTAQIFNGFSFNQTNDRILEGLLQLNPDNKLGGEFSTPLEVARQMVTLSDPESKDRVLDPAAGRGTILSLATANGATGIGVDLNQGVVSLATFYIDLFDRDVSIISTDFFELDSSSEALPDTVEHIIVDPPFNMKIDSNKIPLLNENAHVDSQYAFLAKGLSLLEEGGSLTIAVPTASLHGRRTAAIRETILNNFQLESVIQLVNGPIYRYTSIDTTIITVKNSEPTGSHIVQYKVIESPDDPIDALEDAVSAVNDGIANTIGQSKLKNSLDFHRRDSKKSARAKLRENFNSVIELAEVADIKIGQRPNDILEAAAEDTIPFVTSGDITKTRSSQDQKFILRKEATTIAENNCVLLTSTGGTVASKIPTEPVAPSDNLIVFEFESHDEAVVYATFFESEEGTQQIEALKSGSVVPRLSSRDVSELYVPQFSKREITEQAEKIREQTRRIKELERERERLARERENLAGEPSDILSDGEDDE